MNEENRNQPPVNPPTQPAVPQPRPSGGMTLQPSTAFTQEMQDQPQTAPPEWPQPEQPEQQFAQPAPQLVYQPQPQPQAAEPAPQPVQQPVYNAPQPQQPQSQQVPATPEQQQPQAVQFQQQPAAPQGPPGSIGSSPGGVYEPPKPKRFIDSKILKIIIPALLVIIVGTVAALFFTGVISLTGLKNVSYTSQRGTEYGLQFYTDYEEKQISNGDVALISAVSKKDKFPVILNISSTEDTGSKRYGDDCSMFSKVMDVENKNLDQTLNVCGLSANESDEESAVYIIEFIANDQNHLVTIAQDYGSIDLSNAETMEASQAKIGLAAYNDDIKKILSSIKLK